MDMKRVDALLAYILSEAQKSDDFREHSLGPIHFIKYVYLADLAYAEVHDGETFTGIHWKFHYFGPWDLQLWQRIAPSLAASGAQAINFPSDFSDSGYTRWEISSLEAIRAAAEKLPIDLQGLLSRAIKKFANSTADILHFVYNTPPMLRAAPEEILDFTPSGWFFENDCFSKKKDAIITEKQAKKIKQWKSNASQQLQSVISKKITQKKSYGTICTESLYDEVYFAGVASLEDDMNTPVQEGEIKISVDNNVWKSRARYDP